ncbi:hypothetical protein Hanom_Chr14g01310911 [Helianthus anomalus]
MAEAMLAAVDVPVVSVSKVMNGFHECANCFSPALLPLRVAHAAKLYDIGGNSQMQ